ncbi:hypothetical protein R1flu_012650 [Riccia fluitans]|uniref:Uncharacterized protein n=1 Tax=Riccia fluitans TaxID=41844 RepID=A0ABD1ZCD2_9MARC
MGYSGCLRRRLSTSSFITRPDSFNQDRFSDENPHGNGARSASAFLTRNNSSKDFPVSAVLQTSSSRSSAFNGARPTMFPMTNGNFIPRLSMEGLAAQAGGINGELMLQQAQAHISQL